MTDAGHLDVSPKDLYFRADSKKQPPTIMYLSNNTDSNVAFKVKTTAPKRYCVKPSADVVPPKTTMEVKVFMQQTKEITAASAAECKDKFLIQSTPVPADWSVKSDGDGKSADYFNRKENPKLFEEKLKVTLGAPAQPPSPVMEASETAELNSADTSSAAYKLGGAAATGAISRDMPESLSDYKTENRKLREQLALAELRSTEMSAQVGTKNGAGAAAASPAGITLLHLLLVAIVAYILGVYLR
eukprot:jgi/Ulvmu1/7741/UM039_0049.1